MTLIQNETPKQTQFDTALYLKCKVKAREYFFHEHLNYGLTPDAIGILAYLRNFFEEEELPPYDTVNRWYNQWRRSN